MPLVEPQKLLKELSELWVGLGKGEGASQGVLRACAMTFIVVTEAENTDVGETLAALMPEHPSRAIVVILDPKAEEVSARVFAQCWMPFGRRQQICCEEVEITTPPGKLKDIANVILGLTVPDLPVVMWSRCPSLFDLPEFSRLLPLIDKLIVDSNGVEDPRGFLQRLAAIPEVLVADLAWTRLTRWRETVAHVFANPEFSGQLPGIHEVVVDFGGDVAPTRGYYLAAWINACLGGKIQSSMHHVEAEAGIHGMALKNGGFQMSLELLDGSQAELRAGTLVTRLVFQRPNDYMLLREELKILGHDRAYERALAGALDMSKSS